MLTLASDEELWWGLHDGCGGRSGGSSARAGGVPAPACIPPLPRDHIARIRADARYKLCGQGKFIQVKKVKIFMWSEIIIFNSNNHFFLHNFMSFVYTIADNYFYVNVSYYSKLYNTIF